MRAPTCRALHPVRFYLNIPLINSRIFLPCYHRPMKSESQSSLESRVKSSPVEMIEGPEAAERFTRLVRGIMNVPGADVRKQIEKEHKARIKKKRAKN